MSAVGIFLCFFGLIQIGSRFFALLQFLRLHIPWTRVLYIRQLVQPEIRFIGFRAGFSVEFRTERLTVCEKS